jgi:serine/threonine protein kinase
MKPSFRHSKIRKRENLLGRGGCGKVYRVTLDDHTYAVKRLDKKHRDERHVLRRLGPHPNIVPFITSFRKNGAHYLVFEVCQRLPKAPLKVEVVKQIVRHILRALYLIHETHGLRYGDVKRENVMIYKDHYVLIDFGYCGEAEDASGLGTLDYMAPELLKRSKAQTHKANDVWALGSLVFELLTGERPFYDVSERITERNIRRGSVAKKRLWNALDSSSQAFLSYLWVLDPEKRPPIKDVVTHPWLAKVAAKAKKGQRGSTKRRNVV